MLRALFDAASESLFVVAPEGTILMANSVGAKRLGLNERTGIGSNMHELAPDLVPSDLLESRFQVIAAVARSNKPRCVTDEREGCIWHTTYYPVLDPAGHVTAVAICSSDITERVSAQRRLDQYRREIAAGRQLAALGAAAASLLHQLRQPVSGLTLSVENALADIDEDTHRPRVVQSLQQASTQISALTQLLQKWRKQFSGTPNDHGQPANVAQVAEQMIQLIETAAWRARVTVRSQGLAALPAVQIAEFNLRRALYAIVENAIQAANGTDDRTLEISGEVIDDRVELRFADDCGGLAAKDPQKVFEPFYTTKNKGEGAHGMGLGLHIARQIVREAAGTITVETESGKGTTFVVSLPAVGNEDIANERSGNGRR